MTWDDTHILVKALLRNLAVCAILALIFTVLGVYDSDRMPLIARAAFWTIIMCLGGLSVSVIEPLVFGKLMKNRHPAFQIITIALIISVPLTIFLTGLNTRFSFSWPLRFWAAQYGGVIVISLIIVAGRYLAAQFINRAVKATNHAPKSGIDQFLERLPVKFRRSKLYAISSEGHYLRAYTEAGSTLILMRISDAVKELEGSDGLQVHRSWRVARDGIAETQRIRGRRLLVLKNGETVPVSRSFLPALKASNLAD